MRGTRRTIVAAAGSLALVLGVGGVAAATSGHGSRTDVRRAGRAPPSRGPTTSSGHRHQRGKGPGSRHVLAATSTTVADDDTSTTVDDDTATTTIDARRPADGRLDHPDDIDTR